LVAGASGALGRTSPSLTTAKSASGSTGTAVPDQPMVVGAGNHPFPLLAAGSSVEGAGRLASTSGMIHDAAFSATGLT
jgi:hypothetical protein